MDVLMDDDDRVTETYLAIIALVVAYMFLWYQAQPWLDWLQGVGPWPGR